MCLTARRQSGRTLLRFTRTPALPQVCPHLSVHVGHAVRVGPVLVRVGTSTLPAYLHGHKHWHKKMDTKRMVVARRGARARAALVCK